MRTETQKEKRRAPHRSHANEYQRKYRIEHRDSILKRRRELYAVNHEKIAATRKALRDNGSSAYARRVAAGRELVAKYKGPGCSVCKEADPCCLAFHHVDVTAKRDSVAHMVFGAPTKRLLEEIQKCVLLCFNCHAKIHNKNS